MDALCALRRRAARGFTLVEILIVVAIVAILMAVAVPSYNEYVRRGRLVEGIGGLMTLRVKLERHYQDFRGYGAAGGPCGLPAAVMPTSSYFAFTCTVGATDQQYTIQASNLANVGLGAAGSYVYVGDENDARSTPFFAGSPQVTTCWLRKIGSCS